MAVSWKLERFGFNHDGECECDRAYLIALRSTLTLVARGFYLRDWGSCRRLLKYLLYMLLEDLDGIDGSVAL